MNAGRDRDMVRGEGDAEGAGRASSAIRLMGHTISVFCACQAAVNRSAKQCELTDTNIEQTVRQTDRQTERRTVIQSDCQTDCQQISPCS